MCHQKTLQLVLECFFVYPVRGIEQGGALQRTKNSPVDCFLARGRFPRVSPKNTPAYAGVFFCVSRARNRTGQCAAAHKKQSSGLFFSPREIPAGVTRNTPAYAGVFFRISRARNRTRRCAGAFVRDNGTLFFGCILDMKIPPELSEFFSVYSRATPHNSRLAA